MRKKNFDPENHANPENYGYILQEKSVKTDNMGIEL